MKKVLVQRSLAAVNTVDRLAVKALEEDPNIFDYDGAVDNIQASKNPYLPAKSLPTQDQPVTVIFPFVHQSFKTLTTFSVYRKPGTLLVSKLLHKFVRRNMNVPLNGNC